MPFTLLEYVVRVANDIRSKFSEFSIDYNTNLPKMAQECTPEVTSSQMKFLTALREKGQWARPSSVWSRDYYSSVKKQIIQFPARSTSYQHHGLLVLSMHYLLYHF